MITNTYTVSYAVLSGCSLAMGASAGAVGVRAGWKWGRAETPERQHQLERLSYLAVTLVTMALLVRLYLVPYWFWTLQSLVPAIPGAMCLAGVHLANSPASFISSIMKLFVPFIYGFWLMLSHIDRRIEAQPFARAKLLLLAPLGLSMVAEAAVDIAYLAPLKPRPVSCCTSLFDLPVEGVPDVIMSTNSVWVIAFVALSVAIAILLIAGRRGGGTARVPAILTIIASLSALVVFFLALHTRLSPLLLNAPYHHCVFCLWQAVPVSVLLTALVMVGLWLAFSQSVVRLMSRRGGGAALPMLDGAALWGALILTAGLLVFLASLFWGLATAD